MSVPVAPAPPPMDDVIENTQSGEVSLWDPAPDGSVPKVEDVPEAPAPPSTSLWD